MIIGKNCSFDHRVYEQDTAVEVAVVVANDDDSLVGRHGTQPLETTLQPGK